MKLVCFELVFETVFVANSVFQFLLLQNLVLFCLLIIINE